VVSGTVAGGAGSTRETWGFAAVLFFAAFFFGALLRALAFEALLAAFFLPFDCLASFPFFPLLLALAFAILKALAKHLFLSLFFFF
jgi:hypothetical protein